MHKIDIKPLSVNQAWKGRRFKTDKYNAYERRLMLMLPVNIDIPVDNIHLRIEFGFSNKLSDFDNPIKPFIDILQKKYNFNDRQIFRAEIFKEIVPKGKEYIKFSICAA